MDVDQILTDLCRSHGVSRAFGERLRPLLERAAESEKTKRESLLRLVERSFAEEAERVRREGDDEADLPALSEEELRVLRTVADLLHGWNPPVWLSVWERHLRDGA